MATSQWLNPTKIYLLMPQASVVWKVALLPITTPCHLIMPLS